MMNELSVKQLEYIKKANRRWNFKVGATRSGKTFVDLAYVIGRKIRERRGLAGLNCIIGVTVGTVERNVLAPMRELHGSGMIQRINNKNICMLFGEPVYVIGAHKACQTAKLRGSGLKYVYGDEVAEWSAEVFELLKSRLDKPYSRFDGTCNPEGPTHWLKQFLDKSNAYIQNYRIDDNPFLDSGFVAELKKEYSGTMYYGRYIEGLWTAADGLVYPKFGDANVVHEASKTYERYVVSMDYGTRNATAMLLFGHSDGVWTCFDEYYYSGLKTGFSLTDEEFYEELQHLIKQNVSNSNATIIVDPSAVSFITVVKRRGEYAVKRADNDVLNGIRNTASALSRGSVRIHSKCKNLLSELAQYSWAAGSREERPEKVNDHACDALRYFVRTMRV